MSNAAPEMASFRMMGYRNFPDNRNEFTPKQERRIAKKARHHARKAREGAQYFMKG